MTGFRTDNPFEIELNKMQTFLEGIKREQTVFMSTHHQMPTKEKVKLIQKIQIDHKRVAQFIEKAKQEEINNAGIRFKLESLKSSFQTLLVLWRKIETS